MRRSPCAVVFSLTCEKQSALRVTHVDLATLKGEGIREQKSEFLSSAFPHEFDIDFLGN
jgi:hypothetical protein